MRNAKASRVYVMTSAGRAKVGRSVEPEQRARVLGRFQIGWGGR